MAIKRHIYIIGLLLFYCLPIQATDHAPLAANGVLDLRQHDFKQKVNLDGQWFFYWKQLLNPGDRSNQGVPIAFPSLWSGYELNGEKLPSYGYATYKLTVLLPKSKQNLRMSMPDVYSSYRLFLNGKVVAQNGKVTKSEKGFQAHWQYKAFNIHPGVDTLHLVLQISNFVHSKGGIKKPLVLGNKDIVELDRQRDEAIDLLLTGCLFMGGLFFLGLYIFGNRDKAILLFSLYSIIFSYRIIGIDNYVLHTLLPDIDFLLAMRLEYITLFTGIGLFGLYTRYLYPEDISKVVLNIIIAICFVFTFISLFFAPVIFSQLINPFLIVMVFCLIYIPYVYYKTYRKKRPGAIYALVSSVSLMFVFAISLFHYWGLIPQLQILTFLGYVSFFFLQSLVLSHRVSFVLRSAREQAEQGLVAKSEFLSTMSHEIRTPLNSVIGMSYLLLKNNPRPDQVEQLDVMIFSANNLLNIVNDILDFNKMEAGKITFEHIETDIAFIAGNVVNSLKNYAQDKGIELKLEIDKELKNKVLGDPTRISQLITNLAHNAIKFTPSGFVKVIIKVQNQTPRSITLEVRVKDTGIGISKAKQALIFERFTQADSSTSRGFGGTGLGLAICKRILELQGSELHLESEIGMGSTFYFTQTFEKGPVIIEKQSIDNNLPLKEGKPFTDISILLVEDNAMNVMVAQTFLKRWGATIDVAENGLDAVNKLDVTKHKLVLMDLHMPVMDGYEASRKIRAKGISIPIIALTATIPAEVEYDIRQAGMNDIVAKPFLPDELYRKVLHYVTENAD
ncbi:MAG: response regulator [Sphingobacteriaceae bacterium]|nr:MAG: response regulator [Sphingobacteriaceae bacterium]